MEKLDQQKPENSSPSKQQLNDVELLRSIDHKLVNAGTPDEAKAWLSVRNEALEQEQRVKAQAEARFFRRTWLVFQLLLSFACIVSGIVLVIKGFWMAGFFVLGAGLYVGVADYVTMFFKEVWHGKK